MATLLIAAIRVSLRAVRTTPCKNLLTEGGFDSLHINASKIKFRLIHKIFSTKSFSLHRDATSLLNRKSEQKYPSTLAHMTRIVKKYNINRYIIPTENHLPWLLQPNIFVNNLKPYNKSCNVSNVFKRLFIQQH